MLNVNSWAKAFSTWDTKVYSKEERVLSSERVFLFQVILLLVVYIFKTMRLLLNWKVSNICHINHNRYEYINELSFVYTYMELPFFLIFSVIISIFSSKCTNRVINSTIRLWRIFSHVVSQVRSHISTSFAHLDKHLLIYLHQYVRTFSHFLTSKTFLIAFFKPI